jgi:hypothetical protein
MILAAVWFLRHGGWWPAHGFVRSRGAIAMPIACGILVAISCAIGLRNMLPSLEREHAANLNLMWTCDELIARAPAGSVVIADQGGGGPMQQLLNFLQFKGDYELYAASAFTSRGAGWRPGGDRESDQPNPLQPARQKYLRDVVYANKSEKDLVAEEHRIIDRALGEHRRAFVMAPVNFVSMFRGRFAGGDKYDLVPVLKWKEPATVPSDRTASPLMPQQRAFGPGGGRAQQTWQLFEIKRKPRPATVEFAQAPM